MHFPIHELNRFWIPHYVTIQKLYEKIYSTGTPLHSTSETRCFMGHTKITKCFITFFEVITHSLQSNFSSRAKIAEIKLFNVSRKFWMANPMFTTKCNYFYAVNVQQNFRSIKCILNNTFVLSRGT